MDDGFSICLLADWIMDYEFWIVDFEFLNLKFNIYN